MARASSRIDGVGGGAGGGVDMTQSMELVLRGQSGDAGAVNELLTRYIPRIRRAIRIRLGRALRARIEVDDVLQETLMVATRRLPELELRTPASIYLWMAKIADNVIKGEIERLGAQKRDPARERRIRSGEESTDSVGPGVIVASRAPSPSQQCAATELEAQIDACVEGLEPPDYREVIVLRDYFECDWETIRVRLERPSIGAVQDLHLHAQKRLRESLARLRVSEPLE